MYICASKTAHNTLTWGIQYMHCHGFLKGLLFTVISQLLHVLDMWGAAKLVGCDRCVCMSVVRCSVHETALYFWLPNAAYAHIVYIAVHLYVVYMGFIMDGGLTNCWKNSKPL